MEYIGLGVEAVPYLGVGLWLICEILTNGTPEQLPNSVGEAIYWLFLYLVRKCKKTPLQVPNPPKPAITMDDLV